MLLQSTENRVKDEQWEENTQYSTQNPLESYEMHDE